MSASKKKNAHDHNHVHAEVEMPKNPEEQIDLARDLATELGDIFVQFMQGQIDFAEVSFATYDVLSDLHAVSTGNYELVANDDEDDLDDEDDDYDDEEHAREQENLSGEPA